MSKKFIKIEEEVFSWVETLVFAIIVLVIVNSFFFRTTVVDGISMEPTLYDGELLIVSKLFYNVPQKGDVVTFYSAKRYDEVLVKRVIAKEGDTVDIDYDTGIVYVNGEALDEPYIAERIRFKGDVQMPCTVPEGCIFAMGDNRNHSTDSRESTVGMVPYESIIGRVVFRFFPFDRIGTVK